MNANKKNQSKNQTEIVWFKGQWALSIMIVLVITFILFSPSLKNGFTNWDDDLYVTKNETITNLSLSDFKKYSENFVGNFHPLTMFSLAVDHHFFGLNPFYFHLKNILFHLLNTLLVFLLIKRVSKNNLFISAFTAFLFGIHPMHVESVTWIAERKDVLYTCYFLIGLLMYYAYIDKKQILYLLGSAVAFVLSTLSKSAAVVFPVVILLIDYYENRKLNIKSLIEKIPFLVFSLYIGLIALKTQAESNALGDFQVFSFFERIRFASYGFMNYLVKFLIPFNLSSFHPYPDITKLPPEFNLALLAILVFAVYFLLWGRKLKWLMFGLMFYFVTIALVLQFISVGNAVIAERYTYIPYIGLGFIYATVIYNSYINPKYNRYKNFIGLLIVIQMIYLAGTTFSRTKIWMDSSTLWTDVIRKYPNESGAYSNRGHYYRTQNNYYQALQDYNMAIKLNNKNQKAYSNRAKVWFDTGELDKAIEDYNKSIEIKSNNAEDFSNRGAAYGAKGNFDEALKDLNQALKLEPHNTGALANRGYVYFQIGNYQKTLNDYNRFLQLKPNDPDITNTVGMCYMNMGDLNKALNEFNNAIGINPKQGAFYLNRSIVFFKKNDLPNALIDAQRAQKAGYKVNEKYMEQLNQVK